MFKDKVANFIKREKEELKTAKWKALVASALTGLTIIGGISITSFAVDGYLLSALQKQDQGFIALANDMVNEEHSQVENVAVFTSIGFLLSSLLYSFKKDSLVNEQENVGDVRKVILGIEKDRKLILAEDDSLEINYGDNLVVTIFPEGKIQLGIN